MSEYSCENGFIAFLIMGWMGLSLLVGLYDHLWKCGFIKRTNDFWMYIFVALFILWPGALMYLFTRECIAVTALSVGH